jgi:hypothetical protein
MDSTEPQVRSEMTSSVPDPDVDVADPSPSRATVVASVLAVLVLAVSVVLLLSNVEVSGEATGVRSCGSGFDSVVDRSGWELWLARDLDEADVSNGSVLLRTTQCPDAVNRRLALSGLFAAAAGALVVVAAFRRRPREADASPVELRVARLGRATAATGAALGLFGVIALVVLVADADSTLFLYTDRLVVAVVGLIALVPTLALVAIGRFLMLLAPVIGQRSETGDG